MTRFFTLLLAMIVLLTSCSDEPNEPAQPARRTILVYMIATNSLGTNERDLQDLDEMDQAVAAGALDGCRLLVYRVGKDTEQPELFEIKQDKKGNAVHNLLNTYAGTQGVLCSCG